MDPDISDKICFNPQSSSSQFVKETNQEQEVKKDKVKWSEVKEDFSACNKCGYKDKRKHLKSI